MGVAAALGRRRPRAQADALTLPPPRMETLVPILQQVGRAVRGSDLGGHHVPADLVGGSHCHRSRPLPPALRDLQEARCVAVVPLGARLPTWAAVQPGWSLIPAGALPLNGTRAGLHLSLPEPDAQRNMPTRGQTPVRFLEGLTC